MCERIGLIPKLMALRDNNRGNLTNILHLRCMSFGNFGGLKVWY